MHRSRGREDRCWAFSLVVPLIVCAASCESAKLVDGGVDSGPRADVAVPPPPDDLGPRDGGPDIDAADTGPGDDLGPGDMGRVPTPPEPPAPPTAPRGPAILAAAGWLDDTEPTTLLTADPGIVSPDPPDFGDCAPWFAAATPAGAVAHCEPWPTTGHPACADVGSAHFPGASACQPVGPACPVAGGYASDLPMSGLVLFVDPNAGTGGSGTRASPFSSITTALSATGVGSGTVIALAPGTYTGAITLPDGVTLWGACPRTTILMGVMSTPTVQIPASGGLRNVRVTGGSAGITTMPGSDVTLRAVVLDSSNAPLVVAGAMVADDLVVRDARKSAPPGSDDGHGVVIESTGSLVVHRGVIERSEGAGFLARGALTIEDVAVLEAQRGIHLRSGPELVSDRLVVEQTMLEAIFAEGPVRIDVDVLVMRDDFAGLFIFTEGAPTAQLRRIYAERISTSIAAPGPFALSDAILRGPVGGAGDAIQVWVATATLDRVRVENAPWHALSVWEGADVTATSFVVVDAGSARPGLGAGARATDHATLTLRQAEIDGARGAAISAGGCLDMCFPERLGTGTVIDARDVRIRRVTPTSGPGVTGAWALLVTGGATMTVTRASIEPAMSGVAAVGFESIGSPETLSAGTLEMNDCVLRTGAAGGVACIMAADGAEVTLNRSVFAGWAGRVLDASGAGTTLQVTDSVIADVTSPSIGEGAGASVRDGAELIVDQSSFLRIADVGVRAESAGATVALSDTTIERVGEGPAEHDGVGLLAIDGVVVSLARVAFSELARAGIDVSGDGTMLDGNDVSVSAVHGLADGNGGYGVLVTGGAEARFMGVLVRDVHEAGMLVGERDSSLVGNDVTLAGAGGAGQGIVASNGGSITLRRAAIDAVRGLGAGSFGSSASLTATDLRVSSTLAEMCEADLCAATGVGAYDGAVLEVNEFAIEETAHCGAHLASDARTALSAGVVADAEVCVALRAGIEADDVLTDVVLRRCASSDFGDTAVRPRTLTAVRAP